MRLKNIPPINIVLFLIMLGIVIAGVIGLTRYIKSQDQPYNNFVESTHNAALSKYYTDSLSKTALTKFGSIEVTIYDSIENMPKHFVLCTISNTDESVLFEDVKQYSLRPLLAIFPIETWNGELNYRLSTPGKFRSITVPLHPKQLEMTSDWNDD